MLKVNAAHLQAWALMNKKRGADEFALLTIMDKTERAGEALRHRDHLSADAVSSALIQFLSDGTGPEDAHTRALALYAATHRHCPLPAPVLDAMANQLEGIFSPAAFPVTVPRKDQRYVSELLEEPPDALNSREFALRYYDNNLAKRVYELTGDVQACKHAVNGFRVLRKKFGRAMAETGKGGQHE